MGALLTNPRVAALTVFGGFIVLLLYSYHLASPLASWQDFPRWLLILSLIFSPSVFLLAMTISGLTTRLSAKNA